jgi:hypothetical protein
MINGMLAGKSRSRLALSLLPFLIAGFFAVRNLATWPARMSYPGDEAYEGVALADMVHLRQGVPIYAAGARDGFSDGTYGPLYYMLGARLTDPSKPSYLPLRILSVFAMLGCAVCCGVLAFWLTRVYWVACLSPLVFLAYGMVTGHGILALSDGGAVFLAFLGFLVAYRFRNGRGVWLAAPVMVLSFFYKPQYIAGPCAVMLYLLIEKRYKLAAGFAGIVAACGLGLLGFFQFAVFPGQAFWRHFLFFQAPLLSWRGFFRRALVAFVVLIFLPLTFGIEYLRMHRDKLIASYLFVGLALGMLTYSKDGSGAHYFFESVFVLCAVVPAVIADKLPGRVYPMDLIVFLGVMLFLAQWQTKRPPQPADITKYEAMQSFLRRNFSPHALSLCSNPGELLQAGLDAPFAGVFQLEALAQRGVVSDRQLVDRVRSRQFALIILRIDAQREKDPYWETFALTSGVLRAVRSEYQLDATFDMPAPLRERPEDRFYVYVPRSEANPAGLDLRHGQDNGDLPGARATQAASHARPTRDSM